MSPSFQAVTSNRPCTLPIQCTDITSCPDCSELEDVSRKIRELNKRQAAILARVNTRRDPISSKLPPEVVCCIFEEYVKLHQMNPPPKCLPLSHEIQTCIPQYFDTFHRSAPLRLGSVCQMWRQIAWSNPKLWSSLLVQLDILGHLHSAELVTEWLIRSKTLPLDIKLDGGFQLDDHDPHHSDTRDISTQSPFDSAIAVVKVINKASSRWRGLDFMGVNPQITMYLTDYALDPDADLLHPARLQHFSASRRDADFEDATTFFGNAKQPYSPTHLAINWAHFHCPVNIDFSRLTHMHLTDVYARSLWDLLKSVSQSRARLLHLVAHQIQNVENFYSDLDPLSMITLPTLHSLSVTSWDTAGRILNHLSFPALKSLRYKAYDTTFPGSIICSLIQRSGCALDHLILDDATDSEESLSSVLHSVPTLNKLTVLFQRFTRQSWLFTRLSQGNSLDGNSGTPFLPMLRHLHVISLFYLDWSCLKRNATLLNRSVSPSQQRFKLDSVEFVQSDRF